MSKALVLDCNVLVSALITRAPHSAPAGVLDAIRKTDVELLLSLDLIQEYRDVLCRPRIAARHGLTSTDQMTLLAELVDRGTMLQPADTPAEGPDPNDAHLWRLLRMRESAVLITGDKRLIAEPPPWAHVLDPATWLSRR